MRFFGFHSAAIKTLMFCGLAVVVFGAFTTLPAYAAGAPTVDIVADGSNSLGTVTPGTRVTISWTSTDADSCYLPAFGWMGTRGSRLTTGIYKTREYTIECYGKDGVARDRVTIGVNQTSPSISLRASPNSITTGESAIVTWSVSNADACTASGAWTGTKHTSGSQTVRPSATAIYGLLCTNADASTQDSVTVSVYSLPTTTTPPPSSPVGGLLSQDLFIIGEAANLTLRETTMSSLVNAGEGDVLEFAVRIRNVSSSAGPVTLRSALPPELTYLAGSTRSDGNTAPDGVARSGISIGTLEPREERTVRFKTQVKIPTTSPIFVHFAYATIRSKEAMAPTTIRLASRGGAQVASTPPTQEAPSTLTGSSGRGNTIASNSDDNPCLFVTPTASRDTFEPGEELAYVVNYRNECARAFTNAELVVTLPEGVDFEKTSLPLYARDANVVMYSVGDIAENFESSVVLTGKVREGIDQPLVLGATLTAREASGAYTAIATLALQKDEGTVIGSVGHFATVVFGSVQGIMRTIWFWLILTPLAIIITGYWVLGRNGNGKKKKGGGVLESETSPVT